MLDLSRDEIKAFRKSIYARVWVMQPDPFDLDTGYTLEDAIMDFRTYDMQNKYQRENNLTENF